MNTAFGPDTIGGIDADVWDLRAGLSLSEAFLRSGVELEDATAAFVDGWPTALQAAVRAVVFENLTRSGTVPVTFAWAPGSDFEATIWDVRDTAETAGGITVLFRSRYPDDPHPLARETSA
jgi:hypothetical protein